MGAKRWKEEMREELSKDPVKIQDFILEESEEETYLGIQISSKGLRDSVTKSIRRRIQAAVVKEIQLSKVLDDPMMDKLGWIEAVKTLFSSVITSTVTYGSQSYVFMTKAQEDELESGYREILYRMLRISKYTHYAAVLMECNLIRVRHIVNQLKLTFFNSLKYEKGSGFCLAIIMEEEKLFPGTGFVAEVRKLCDMYDLEDSTEVCLDKDLIREKVWRIGREEIWKETLYNRRIPFNPSHLKTYKPYMRLPRYEAKLLFALKVGELQFKDYRRGEFKAKFGNTLCFGCQEEPDNLEHVMKNGFSTKEKVKGSK